MTPAFRQFFRVFWGGLFLANAVAFAEDTPLRFSADQYKTNLKTKTVSAVGHVKVRLDEYEVSGEKLEYSPESGSLVVSGGFVLEHSTFKITGKKFEYDVRAKTGTFYDSKLKHAKGIILQANELRVVSNDTFQMYQGSLTTCEDCPAAWSFVGAYIDLTIEGYAEIHHALIQIKDLPIFYFPILVLPVKTKRQSGFLFPAYGYSSRLGPQFAQSYYWAPRADFDSVLEYRYFTRAGNKISNETRFRYSNRSFIDLQSSYVRNNELEDVKDNRYGIKINQRYQINPHWTQRWQGEWASDPRYIPQFERDFESYQLPTVSNEPSVSWQSDDYLFIARSSFHQDNLQRSIDFSADKTGLGPIDVLPHLILSQPSKSIYKNIYASWDLEWLSLTRGRDLPDPTTNWIRTGDRATADLRLSTTVVPGRVFAWDPSIELRSDVYHLDTAPGTRSSAVRARFSTQQVVSSEFYNVYDSDLGELRALRHSITPSLRWSYAPKDALSNSPFFNQDANFGTTRGTLESPRFDLFDPRPRSFVSDAVFTTADDESRLQQHNLLTLGVNTSLVGRFGSETKRYDKLLSVGASQDYDLNTQSIGLLRFTATTAYEHFASSFEWIFDTSSDKTSTRISGSYDNGNFKLSVDHQRSKLVDSMSASIGTDNLLGFNAMTSATYDLRPDVDQFVRQRFQLGYKSASHCWYFSLDVQRSPDLQQVGRNAWNVSPNIGISMGTDVLDSAFD